MIPTSVKLGFYLAIRQIWRSNPWSTIGIVFVMILTFLNLVVVSGVMSGMIEGSIQANRSGYIGDIAMKPLGDRTTIENSAALVELAKSNSNTTRVTGRFITSGSVEANYKTATDPNDRELANGLLVGIDPETEISDFPAYIKEGQMLEPGDYDQVILGANLLTRYLGFEIPGFKTLGDVYPGSKVRVRVNGAVRDMTVKGIVRRKVDELDRSIIMTSQQFKDMTGIDSYAIISVELKPNAPAEKVRDQLIVSGAGRYAEVLTFEQGLPKAVIDIRDTFNMLGNMFSVIGLIVAAITVFIVIFINALTRRKFIGIMKGIGISGKAIEFSYVFQSLFYALVGSAIGLSLVFGLIVPYFAKHPIDFPFSDGILVASVSGTMIRVAILTIITFIAGYIPAWMIVRRNTLNSILGR
jgi:putative ABC transport system permease protein